MFNNEINILVDVPIEELKKVDAAVAKKINSFRNGWVQYVPGGGGNYGKPVICDSKEEFEKKGKEIEESLKADGISQKTLGEF